MLQAIMAVLQALLNFMGVIVEPQTSKKVEEILPEKSASEQALEQLQAAQAAKK